MLQQLEAFFQEVARAEQMGFDGSHRKAERLGNLLIGQFLQMAQDQDGAILPRQFLDSLPNSLLALSVSDQGLNFLA